MKTCLPYEKLFQIFCFNIGRFENKAFVFYISGQVSSLISKGISSSRGLTQKRKETNFLQLKLHLWNFSNNFVQHDISLMSKSFQNQKISARDLKQIFCHILNNNSFTIHWFYLPVIDRYEKLFSSCLNINEFVCATKAF